MTCARTFEKLLIVLLCTALASPAAAEVYRWVDDEGRSHFTDSVYDVPAKYRDQLREISGDLEADDRLSVIEGLNPRAERKDKQAEPEGFAGLTNPGELDVAALGWGMIVVGSLVFALTLGIALLLSAVLMCWACRLVDVEPPGLAKAMGVCLLQIIASGTASGALDFTLALGGGPSLAAIGMRLVLGLVVSVLVYASVLRALVTESFPDAVKVTVVYWIVCVVLGVGLGMALILFGGVAATI